MLTTNELREQLVADAEAAPQNIDRTSQVRQRVSAHRRRRAIGTGVASLAVLAVAALVVVPQLGGEPRTAPPAGPSPSTTGDSPLPQYHLGGLLIAESEHVGSVPFTVPFTASNNHLTLTVDCYVPGGGNDARTMVSFEANGEPLAAMSCNETGQFLGGNSFSQDPGGVDAVDPGQPGSLRVFFEKPVPDTSRVRVGIYEQVPIASYHFPEAPDPLPPLDLYGNLLPREHKHPLVLVSAGPLPADAGETVIVTPNGTWSADVTLNHGLSIESQTVAPGELHFLVDGKEVASDFGWDYDNGGAGATLTLAELGVSKGDTVTLMIRAERFPGSSWAVLFADEAS